ncbi:MAG: polysaccharide deacetylase family protein [Rhizobiales bacterium]|nr:polysaccharide deacetylase family protein [Hyphomicrobiales bacterium]
MTADTAGGRTAAPAWSGRIVPDRIVLTFHGLGRPATSIDPAERPYWVEPGVFSDVLARARAEPRIEITFDDGNASDMSLAFPLLATSGLSATFFVLAGRLDQPGSLSRRDLAELAGHGMVIGNHGEHHVDWTKASDAVMRRELHDARARIEDAAGRAVDSLSVPFGAFDRRVLRLIAEAGYRRVHTSSGGLAGRAAWLVPRTSLRSDLPAGAMIDGLGRWPRQLEAAIRNPLREWKYGVNTWTAGRGRSPAEACRD